MDNKKPQSPFEIPPKMYETLQQTSAYISELQNRFDGSVWKPGKQRSAQFAQVYPVTATFIAAFAALAAIPLASFLTVVTFVLVSTTSIALALAIGVTAFVAFWSGVVLFFVLGIVLCLSMLFTLSALGLFLAFRLVFHLRAEKGQGVQGWAKETKGRFVPRSAVDEAKQDYAAEMYAKGTKPTPM